MSLAQSSGWSGVYFRNRASGMWPTDLKLRRKPGGFCRIRGMERLREERKAHANCLGLVASISAGGSEMHIERVAGYVDGHAVIGRDIHRIHAGGADPLHRHLLVGDGQVMFVGSAQNVAANFVVALGGAAA